LLEILIKWQNFLKLDATNGLDRIAKGAAARQGERSIAPKASRAVDAPRVY
jgi:hypothetical protein